VADGVAKPLVYLLTTLHGSLALLVRPGIEALTDDHALWMNDFKTAQLHDLLLARPDDPGYLRSVIGGNYTSLRGNLDKLWSSLGAGIVAPLV